MANFVPLKRHLLRCLRVAIRTHDLHAPFLDVGCGQGDVSLWLARAGWSGKAIDFSELAIQISQRALMAFPDVAVEREALESEGGSFETVIAWDVLEHLQDEAAALAALAQRTTPGGHLVLSVPSHPSEWRWDDPFYGHYRRYTPQELIQKLESAGFEVLTIWDSTYPIFWALRRIYTRLKKPPVKLGTSEEQTRASSGTSAWEIPLIGGLLNRSWVLWEPFSYLQFKFFRNGIHRGHELFVVARRRQP